MGRAGDEGPTPQAGSPEPEVSLADAGIAAEIARAAASGRGADRAPTLEQLLAAFGEHAPTEAGRRRVDAAMRVAGMESRPSVLQAEAGQRLLLIPPGSGGGGARGRAAIGLLAVAGILVAAAVAAALLGGSDGDRASDSLPAGTTLVSIGGATDTTATETATVATTPTTTTEDAAAAEEQAAAERRRARAKARREREARRKRAAAAEARRKTVTVVVDASAAPTFLCVDDGDGQQLYSGTLSGKQTFRERLVRLNIGLASTVVTVNGTRVPLSGSPAGLEISRQSGARELPLGQRPCG